MSNAEMAQYWNESAGPIWVAQQQKLDAQIGPFGALARERAAVRAGERVLDVGCGCGETTLELAQAVGADGQLTAVDISRPMLEYAAQRARDAGLADRIAFRLEDAQTADIGADSFDLVFSRFGVMFFADPVAAFANLRRALRPGGRLVFVCWQPANKNPWMTAPARAAAQHMVFPPAPPPDAPGPFAFGDAARVRGILEAAGFANVAHEALDGPIRLAGDSVEEALELYQHIGPLGAALREAKPDATQRARVLGAVRAVLESFQTPRGIEAESGAWIVTAGRGR
jgi:SAM-dependent methyltransferase